MTRTFASAAAILLTLLVVVRAQQPAVPLDPVDAILDAFKSHPLVVVGEDHGNAAEQAFLRSLIGDARFAATVNDIVVESGNAQFQDVMDRFTAGGDVPGEQLAQVWLYAAEVFRNPIYEAFFRAVRQVNNTLPAPRQLRVLLGEAPDHLARDEYAAGLIERDVLAKRRRALVIYGNGHTLRRHSLSIEDVPDERSLVRRLELTGAVHAFSMWTESRARLARIQPDVASWRTPSLALLRDTALGMADFAMYFPAGGLLRLDGRPVLRDGQPVMLPPRKGLRMEDQVDAVLVIG